MIVSFEGVNGAGKTCLLEALSHEFNTPFKIIRSPGGTPECEKTRRLVKAAIAGDVDVPPERLVELNVRDFSEANVALIRPSLDKGETVLLDRWVHSTFAYQGSMGADLKFIERTIAEYGIPMPDLTIMLDIDPAQAQERHTPDQCLSDEQLCFKRKVRAAYLELARKDERVEVIDANAPPDEVRKNVISTLIKKGVRIW